MLIQIKSFNSVNYPKSNISCVHDNIDILFVVKGLLLHIQDNKCYIMSIVIISMDLSLRTVLLGIILRIVNKQN